MTLPIEAGRTLHSAQGSSADQSLAAIRCLASLPMASPSYARGPHRFIDREYLIISYESGPAAVRAALAEALGPDATNTVG